MKAVGHLGYLFFLQVPILCNEEHVLQRSCFVHFAQIARPYQLKEVKSGKDRESCDTYKRSELLNGDERFLVAWKHHKGIRILTAEGI